MEAAENMVISGTSRTVLRREERGVDKSTEANYEYTLGWHRDWTRSVITRNGNNYSATVTYGVRDYYDWANDNEYKITLGGILNVAANILYQFHEYGVAQNFNTSGEATVQLTWTVGQRSDTGAVIVIP